MMSGGFEPHDISKAMNDAAQYFFSDIDCLYGIF